MKKSLVAGVVALMLASAAHADGFPDRPIRFIVPFAAGGGGDISSRIVAKGMSEYLKQPVVVENKAGGGGQVGMSYAAREPADGYTIVFGSSGSITVLPHLKELTYDPFKDLAPVGKMAVSDGVVVVKNDFPAKTIPEFIQHLKDNPGNYDYGSSGNGTPSHLSGVLFEKATGTKLQHIGYRGDGPAVSDLLGGTIPMMFTLMASVVAPIEAGSIRPIAAYGPKRSKLLPDVPTFVESGYPDLTYSAWFGIFAPAGTPADRVNKLNEALNYALAQEDIGPRLASLGIEPAPSTPQELSDYAHVESDRWKKVIEDANITLEAQ